MDRRSGFGIGSAVVAAVLAAGTLSGCASNAAGGSLAGGSGTADSPAPTLALPSVQATGVTVVTTAAGGGPTISTTKAAAGGGATAAGVPQCMTADLSAQANIVAGSAASGHITIDITITNTSGHKCTVYGFPGLRLEDQNQDAQPTKVDWDPAVPKTLITLANGQSASSDAHIDKDLPVGSEPLTGPCEPASYYLQITAPNNTSQLVARIGDTGGSGITVCDFGDMDVLAFVPGTVGPQQ